MRRYPDWDIRLTALLAECSELPFQYGSWDCFQFARRALLAMTGQDIAAPFQPYHSWFGYTRQMLRYCQSSSLVAFADKLLAGLLLVDAGFAQRGDAALIPMPVPAFGIVSLNGKEILAVTELDGVTEFPLSCAMRVWRI